MYGARLGPIDVYRETGEITGAVDHCEVNDRIVVYIPGRSIFFTVYVNPSDGSYKINWVTPRVHSLRIAKNGEVIETINGVTVVKKSITDNGTMTICRDADGDTYDEDVDCDDSDDAINPNATEVCDSIYNDSDNTIDEGGACSYNGT